MPGASIGPVRVYFDANPLVEEGWPHVGVELSNVLALAGQLGAQLAIPNLVLLELREHWHREFAKEAARARSVFTHKRFGGLPPASFDWPAEREALRSYDEGVRDMLDQHRIAITLDPTADLSSLLEKSARHEAPFRDGDAGFRDSCIALAIAEHNGGADSWLVSSDQFFTSGAAGAYLRGRGVTVQAGLATCSAALQDVMKRAGDEAIRRFGQDVAGIQDLLLAELEKNLSDMTEYARAFLALPSSFGSRLATLQRVDDVRVIRIEKVTFSFEQLLVLRAEERQPRAVDRVRFDAAIEADVVERRFSSPEPPEIRVGTDAAPPAWPPPIYPAEARTIEAHAHFEADVRWDDRDRPDFCLTSVGYGTLEDAFFRRMAESAPEG